MQEKLETNIITPKVSAFQISLKIRVQSCKDAKRHYDKIKINLKMIIPEIMHQSLKGLMFEPRLPKYSNQKLVLKIRVSVMAKYLKQRASYTTWPKLIISNSNHRRNLVQSVQLSQMALIQTTFTCPPHIFVRIPTICPKYLSAIQGPIPKTEQEKRDTILQMET